jgi:elongation factor Ts
MQSGTRRLLPRKLRRRPVADIPASLVKELRDQTGAGMMDTKRALVETDGDLDEARRLLRERGMASAAKRAGREVTEGKVLARVDGSTGTIVAIGCESEPVSNNEDFLAFARAVLDRVEADGPEAVEELEDDRVDLVARIGENIVVAGAARLEAEEGEHLEAYIHRPAEKIGVLVHVVGGTAEFARMLAQHISFANPDVTSRDEIDPTRVDEERALFERLQEVSSKPEEVRPRIVDGMLAKRFFAEIVLVDQPWIHDTSSSVGEALAENGAEVREFVRYALTK